jgi:hypothetical protein
MQASEPKTRRRTNDGVLYPALFGAAESVSAISPL